MVRAEILIRPDGEPHVRLEPRAASESDLLQLLLCYGSKLRWSLRRQPEWVRDGFERLSWEVAVTWRDGGVGGRLMDGLPSAPTLQLNADRFEFSAARHERYVVHMYSDERGRGYPCGSLPPNPRRANLIWHFVALAGAIASRLEEEQRAATQPLVLEWWYAMFDNESVWRDELSLNEHIATANRIVAGSKTAGQDGLASA